MRFERTVARERPDEAWARSSSEDPGVKAYRSGTHRTTAPAETVGRLRRLMPAMGITRVANVTGLDRIGVPVVMVVRPNSRSLAVSQGKGPDLDAARASGLMEAAELWHSERITLPLRLCSYRELCEAVPVVDVKALPRIECSRFEPTLRMLWIEGRDLLSNEPLWLPYEMVHTDFTLPLPTGSGCFPASTNGLASGNHPLEAIVHAICEVIERDATTLWHQLDMASRTRTRLDLATVDDPACRDILDRLERAGIAAAVWETTSDVGVPSFRCMIVDERRRSAHPGAGAGCHPAREIALLRALTEAVQVRMTYITGSRDDLSAEEFGRAAMSEKLRSAQALMQTSGPLRDFCDIESRDLPTFAEDAAWLLARLGAVGVREVAIVDLEKPELGLSVARAIIPGLEGADSHGDYVAGPRARFVRGGAP